MERITLLNCILILYRLFLASCTTVFGLWVLLYASSIVISMIASFLWGGNENE